MIASNIDSVSKSDVKRQLLALTLIYLALWATTGCQPGLNNSPTAQPTSEQLVPSVPAVSSVPEISPSPSDSAPLPTQGPFSITLDDLRLRWLSGQPCHPPCWENITPGETSRDQAVEILNSTPFIANVKVYLLSDSSSGIHWDMSVASPDYWGGDAFFESDEIVYAIGTRFPVTKLKELIDAFGQPSHVMALEMPAIDVGLPSWGIHIVWIPYGLAVDSAGVSPPPTIDEELSLTGATFFPPSLEAYGRATYIFNVSRARPWHGVGEFLEYSSSAPLTPIVTP